MPYFNIVENLIYVMICTRPDIVNVVSVVICNMTNLGKAHWQVLKWMLKYLKSAIGIGLAFN